MPFGNRFRLVDLKVYPARAAIEAFTVLPGGQDAAPRPETSDEIQSLPSERQQRSREGIRLGGVGQGNGGEQGGIRWLTGSRIDDVPIAPAPRLEGFAPNGRDG